MGFTLLEVMLAVALLALLVVGFLGAWSYGQDALLSSGNRMRALLLAEEGLDAARNMRDHSYANLITGTHGLSTTSNQWTLSGSSDVFGIYTRTLTIGNIDANRKIATATVAWQQNAVRNGSVSLVTEFTNWLRSAGWSAIVRTFILDFTGNTDFLKVHMAGNYAYVIRNAGTGNDFLVFDISSPDAPVLVGQTVVAGTPSNLAVQGTYAYVSSNANFAELVVVDISNPNAPLEVAGFNAAGNFDASSVAVQGSTAYLTRVGGVEFVILNISDPLDPQLVGSLDFGSALTDVAVRGPHAFVTSSENGGEVSSILISNPASPVGITNLNLPGNQDASAIAVAPNTLAIGRLGGGFYTATSSAAGILSLQGSVVFASDIHDVAVDAAGTVAFTATASGAGEFTTFSIAAPASPAMLTMYDNAGVTAGVLRGVSYRADPERAYLVGESDAAELLIYAPQ